MDLTLLGRVQRGDSRAFERLYDRYAHLAFSVLVPMLGRAAAEETLQEAFMAVWQKADQYDSARGSVKAWLLQIIRNRGVDALRRGRAHPQLASLDLLTAELADPAPELPEILVRERRAERVRWGLAEIPEEQRQVITLAYFRGLTQRQIADALGLPLGTVKKRIRLGLQKLKARLADEEEIPA